MRTDRHNHRQVSGDTEAVGDQGLARAHQNAIWGRQRQVNALRSSLREYYPGALAAFGTDLSRHDAVSVLAIAPTLALGRGLSRSKIASALRRGGRSRNVEKRAEEIQAALRADYLEAPQGSSGGLMASRSHTGDRQARRPSRSQYRSRSPRAEVSLARALGVSARLSSVMTELDMPMPSLARTTAGRHR